MRRLEQTGPSASIWRVQREMAVEQGNLSRYLGNGPFGMVMCFVLDWPSVGKLWSCGTSVGVAHDGMSRHCISDGSAVLEGACLWLWLVIPLLRSIRCHDREIVRCESFRISFFLISDRLAS